MEKSRSLENYRAFDITTWVVMLGIFETLISKAGKYWFPNQPYTLSLVPALTAIVFVRWKEAKYVWFYPVLGGLFLSFSLSGSREQYAVYMIGNLLSLLVLPILKGEREDKIKKSPFLSALYALSIALLMQVGRLLLFSLINLSLSESLLFITTDALSGVFSVVVVLIVRRLDGVFEDQYSYLVRINKEDEKEVVNES